MCPGSINSSFPGQRFNAKTVRLNNIQSDPHVRVGNMQRMARHLKVFRRRASGNNNTFLPRSWSLEERFIHTGWGVRCTGEIRFGRNLLKSRHLARL
ncbi:uncharacterized protein ARMOST_19500 [Armillaria ostoyae]|uniref:Uncharacterized protein n=1 Tax=Armillaria ostoyae TaxID=47428 RepID=A0A284S4V2_ARMOS|nr:uncharacterized protein ARMOST_19500 [Armillaria ostoyae]